VGDRDMSEWKIFDRVITLVAIGEAILLAGLSVWILGWVIGVKKMENLDKFMSAFSGVMISLFMIVVVLLLLALLIMLGRWLFGKEDGLIILPFEVATGESVYSGDALSHLLVAELQRIRKIHGRELEGIRPIESEQLSLPFLAPTKAIASENITYSIANIGTIGTGSTSIPVGQLLVALKGLCPWGNTGRVITGSLQKYGSMISLVACLEHEDVNAWEVSRKIKFYSKVDDEHIPSLVKDLAFKIAHEHAEDPSSAKTWQGFKHFTEALDAYYQYTLAEDIKDLERARKNCLRAASLELKYEKLLGLLYNLGMAYSEKKKYDRAEKLLKQAIEIKPDYGFALLGLGYVHVIQGQNEQAIIYLDKAIKSDPEDALYRAFKGVALSNLERWNEALESFDKAVDLDPEDALYLASKGVALSNLERWNEALESFDKAVDLDPKNARYWSRKGFALEKLERWDEALECRNKAVELDPKNARYWSRKGFALEKLERWDEALECRNKAVELEPKNAGYWSNKGFALGNLKRWDETLECYDKAIELDPENASYWAFKGVALDNLNRHEEALKSYDKVIELDPDDVTAHIALARLHRKQGRKAESARECEEARRLIDTENEYNRACFEAVCGSANEALDLLRSALEKKQATPKWARQDPDFEFIRDEPEFQALIDEFAEKEGGSGE